MDSNYTSSCANCGKGEETSITLKKCGACKMVKYCSLACQKAHRPQHKKECKKHVAELHEEALFKQPPPPEDCPICMLPLSHDSSHAAFESCCGKVICNACISSMVECLKGTNKKNGLPCPFCREPPVDTDAKENERIQKLVDAGNARAIVELGGYYTLGLFDYPIDYEKALELYLRAAELGYAGGYYSLAVCYDKGRAVAKNEKTAKHYYERAAIAGDVKARHNLGSLEGRAGNIQRAYRHILISAKAGFKLSLDAVKEGFINGYVTKDDYATTLRAYQKLHDEMKSDERVKAKEGTWVRPK